MKRAISILALAAILCLSLTGLGEVTGPQYLGTWACGRATITITDQHPGYHVEITWGNSAAEVSQWDYFCPYELKDGQLVSEDTGVLQDLTYGEDGEVAQAVTRYQDGSATFAIDDQGLLHWSDAKEDAGRDMAFDYVPILGFAPEVEEIQLSYLQMIGDESLTQDKKACEALNFAVASELWHADEEALAENLAAAWEGLPENQREAFDGAFEGVDQLLNESFEDWPAARPAFTDGRDERMAEMIQEPLYRRAWDVLREATVGSVTL